MTIFGAFFCRFSWLPVVEDVEESPFVYGYLCDLIEINHPVILGNQNANIPRIIEIFAEAFAVDALPPTHEVYGRMVNITRQVQVNYTEITALLAKVLWILHTFAFAFWTYDFNKKYSTFFRAKDKFLRHASINWHRHRSKLCKQFWPARSLPWPQPMLVESKTRQNLLFSQLPFYEILSNFWTEKTLKNVNCSHNVWCLWWYLEMKILVVGNFGIIFKIIFWGTAKKFFVCRRPAI